MREGATQIPGIAALDERNLIDLDALTFQQSKSVIESAFVYFLLNKDKFATEGFAALSRLPDELRRCLTAAKRMGVDISIEVRGYADAVGTEAKNIDLSKRRAAAVRDFLVSCGIHAKMLKPLRLRQPATAQPDEKPVWEQSGRRDPRARQRTVVPMPFVLALNKADLAPQWEVDDTRIESLPTREC